MNGKKHAGFIDKTNDIYTGYSRLYPNAIDKLRIIDPKKYRTQMVEEFIELMTLGVIRFPYEYSGQEFLRRAGKTVDGEEKSNIYYLSQDEKIAFEQIDLMKYEICSIHKIKNPENTSVRYALPKEKENIMHDDRFYTILLLAHRLYELRRSSALNNRKKKKDSNVGMLFQVRAPKLR